MKQKTTYHWITVAACCSVFSSSIGICTNSMGIFYTPVSEALQVGRGAFALSVTLTALVTGFISPLVARWMRSHSLRIMLLFGILLNTACLALMSQSRSIWLFYVLGALRGVGMACFSLMPVTTVISNWFETRHGLAIGIAMSFSGLSGAVFSPLFSSIIEQSGWQQAYLYMALFSLVLALPGPLFLRLRPEERSLLPYGASAPAVPLSITRKPSEKKALLSLPFLLLAVFSLAQNFLIGVAQHFPGFAETVRLGAGVGALMLSASMVGNIVSKLLLGVLSDKFGPFLACSVMAAINALALGSLLLLPEGASTPALIAAFFYGWIYSVTGVGFSLVTRRLFGMERYSSMYSVVTILTSISGAFSLTAIGAIYDASGAYTAAILFAICCDVIALVSLFGMALRTRRRA